MELDFYIPKYNIAIEINGNYWHSEVGGGKNGKYHLNKTILCNKKGIKLLHFFEDEILFKPNVVKHEILNSLGFVKKKVLVSDCVLKEVEFNDYKEFLNNNHIQGLSIGIVNYGLYYKDDLVFFMNFSKKGSESFELLRYCSKIGLEVDGGFDVLFNNFVDNNSPKEIVLFVDCRIFGINQNNTIYKKIGFEFTKRTNPTFYYILKTDYLIRINRFNLTKQKMLSENIGFNNKQTEFEIAQKLGYDRIWDCGMMKYRIFFKKIILLK